MNTPNETKTAEDHPGYIVSIFDDSAWLRQDGTITDKWEERGVWATEEAAHEAMVKDLK